MNAVWSSSEWYVTLLLIAVTLALLLRGWLHDRSRWPKGPRGLPLLGYVPYLGRFSFETFHNLQQQYGPIFTVSLFTKKLIVVNGLEAIKELFSKDELLARPVPTLLQPVGVRESVVDGSGDTWKEQRKSVILHLRDHGFGKSKMEDLIREEISFLTKALEDKSQDLVDIFQILTPSISNNICIFLIGQRFDYDDPKRIMMDKALAVFPEYLRSTGLMFNFPTIAKYVIKYRLFGFGELPDAYREMSEMVKKDMADHRSTLDEDNPRDFIDSFLIEQLKRQKSGQELGNYEDDVLVANAVAFFVAGSETVLTTVVWGLMLMVKHSDVQRKVQAELDSVIGPERAPVWDDRFQLPYTMAVLLEIQRWASIIPMSLPRRVLSPVVVAGVTLPEGALVVPNLWSAHHDSKLWADPHAFNPLNFYDETTKTVINKDLLIPFSHGKRNCLGETLAQVELFLYFATILLKFEVDESPVAPLSLSKNLAITLQPECNPLLRFNLRS
ncbi:Cytochrome P450 2J3 [Halotydeus destructor]|nr:Cytochrome P450 2J3 [Halotydeus destructor]